MVLGSILILNGLVNLLVDECNRCMEAAEYLMPISCG